MGKSIAIPDGDISAFQNLREFPVERPNVPSDVGGTPQQWNLVGPDAVVYRAVVQLSLCDGLRPLVACLPAACRLEFHRTSKETSMAAAPVLPHSPRSPASPPAPLSEAARILNAFIAPSKTFTDLRRNAAWWAPFLLMVVVSVAFVYVAGQKVGFRKAMENQMQSQPKAQARLENLPPDQREQQMEQGAKVTKIIAYAFPAIQLLILLFIAAVMFATFKFAAGADVSFKISLAIVMYASLPGLLRPILAVVSLLAGGNVDSFTFQNPVATNPGYFMNPADSPLLYGLDSSLDIFLMWTLIVTAIGFTCLSKVKRGTALAIVFGWWAVFTLTAAALGAAFS